MSNQLSNAIFLFLGLLFFSCGNDYVPKPRGFFRIDLPQKKYIHYESSDCPYSFDIPDYAVVSRDSNRLAEPCWMYILFPRFNAQVYLTYKPLDNNLVKFSEDAHTLVYKHTVKADAIDELPVHTLSHVHGLIYDLAGNSASPMQFYVSDSSKHFIRGSLYFNCTPQADSLQPVSAFIKADVVRLVNSISWKN